MSCWILDTEAHPPLGESYVVLTDLRDPPSLRTIERLVKRHAAELINVEDLDSLIAGGETKKRLIATLKNLRPRYVAVAPRMENYRENIILALWDVFTRLDSDPYLDVFPGFLVAADPEALAGFINNSLAYKPSPKKKFFGISLISGTRYKAYQKVQMLKNYFKRKGYETRVLTVYADPKLKARSDFPDIENTSTWNLRGNRRNPIRRLPETIRREMTGSSIATIFAHGTPEQVAGIDLTALREVDLTGTVILTGSCYSGLGEKSDCKMSGRVAGNLGKKGERFGFRAVEQGAVAVYGHMRLNLGFPSLYTVLENYVRGLSIGESYQRLLNAMISREGAFHPAFCHNIKSSKSTRRARNRMLYVQIGDPALVPLKANR